MGRSGGGIDGWPRGSLAGHLPWTVASSPHQTSVSTAVAWRRGGWSPLGMESEPVPTERLSRFYYPLAWALRMYTLECMDGNRVARFQPVSGAGQSSPLAGVAAVLAACTMPPVAALGRMLTFYPVIVGTLTFATGVVAVACRWPSLRSAVAAREGGRPKLPVDLRGLLWAIPLLGLSGMA